MTITSFEPRETEKQFAPIREKEFYYGFYVFADTDRHFPVIDCRLYRRRSKSATVYCCVWISGTGVANCRGLGKAGGGGYDKRSAAVASALRDAGIIVEDVSGVGDGAVRAALLAIAKRIGYNDNWIFEVGA